jgi:iron(III) transport system permease protein
MAVEPLPWILGAILVTLLFWPLGEGVRGAFIDARGAPTFAYVVGVFRNPVYVEGLENALAVAVFSTVLATTLGVSAAFLVHRYEFPFKRSLGVLVPLPLMVPPFVGAIGLKQILGEQGALNAFLEDIRLADPTRPIDWLRQGRLPAIVVLTALHLYPIVYLSVGAALGRLNVEMEEAAENLGCRGFRALRKITLPLVLPSVFGASSIVFIGGLTEFGVPLVFNYGRLTPVQIFYGLKDMERNPAVYVLVLVLLLESVVLYGVARLAMGRRTPAAASRDAGRRRKPRRVRPLATAGVVLALGGLVGVAALPNLAIVLAAFARDWYGTLLPSGFTLAHFRAAVGHELVVSSIANSLRYVLLSTALDLVLGTAIAWVGARSRSRGAPFLDAAAMVPLVVPGLVMAFGYLAISRVGRPLAFLNPARDPTVLLVIAYAVRRLPFIVRSAAAGFDQIGRALEEAATSLGASPLRVVGRVTLPLLAPHLFAGATIVFALSMLEVSDSLILAQRQATYPITKAIYDLFELLGNGRQMAAALGVWTMVFLATALAVVRSILGGQRGLMAAAHPAPDRPAGAMDRAIPTGNAGPVASRGTGDA